MSKYLQSFIDSFKPAYQNTKETIISGLVQGDFDVEETTDISLQPVRPRDRQEGSKLLEDIDYSQFNLNNIKSGPPEIKVDADKLNHGLKRKLKNRHIQMIAIGGSIGTGLFIGSGIALNQGGPASLLINYLICGFMVLCTIFALGELAVTYPIRGSYAVFVSKFIDESLGFSVGWTYALQWVTTMPLEIVAAGIVLQYWTTSVHLAVWITLFLILICIINIFGVKGYGEVEFFCSAIKTAAVVIFIIVSAVIVAGGSPSAGYLGAKRWYNPGAFNNGFKGFCSVFVVAAFSFNGTELIGLAAAETAAPHKTIPKAVKQIVWRVTLFYAVSLFLIGLIVPYNDSRLLDGKSSYDASASPFVISCKIAGIKVLPDIINAVILVSVLSVGNSSVFASSRTLAALGAVGQAPKCFAYIDRAGRPLVSVLISLAFGLLAYIQCAPQGGEIFMWLLALSGLSVLFIWLAINMSHIQFRKAWAYNGKSLSDLPWTSPLGTLGSYCGCVLNILALLAQLYVAISPIGQPFTWKYFFSLYLAFFFSLACYVGHKIYRRGRGYVPFRQVDIDEGRRNVDIEVIRQERFNLVQKRKTQNWLRRMIGILF